jgi:hypothetical protein
MIALTLEEEELTRVTLSGQKEAAMLSRRSRYVAAVLVMLCAAVYLSGCIQIQVIDRTPSTVEGVPSTQNDQLEEHNLAVLAVDFDPPLEYQEIISRKRRGEGITLLVAVENTGATSEHDVSVEVDLSKDDGQTLFLHKSALIDAIAPGEITLVRFKDTEIPFSYEYQLRVRVEAVEGELYLVDNEKSYDLLVTEP